MTELKPAAPSMPAQSDCSPRRAGAAAGLVFVIAFAAAALLSDLGNHVLTRHETFAAEPGREIRLDPNWKMFAVPKLAGVYRTAKPPGMMWLIAGSIAALGQANEFAARLPSALAGVAICAMVFSLTARWYGTRLGVLAGLMQATFFYTQSQARLTEADMALAAAVCLALWSLAMATVPSPRGLAPLRPMSWVFYAAAWVGFMLKGPIALAFIFSTTACWLIVRRDRAIVRFLVNIPALLLSVAAGGAWVLAALHVDPIIYHDWFSEAVGTTTGEFGRGPFYYYFFSAPFVLLPWTPLILVGIWLGVATKSNDVTHGATEPGIEPNEPAIPIPRRRGPIAWAAAAPPIAWFCACWFIPGILFLSLVMSNKHHHYPIPLFPPLSIAAAAGMEHFIRWRHERGRPATATAGAILSIFGGLIGCVVVTHMRQIPAALHQPLMIVIAVLTAGLVTACLAERFRWPRMHVACLIGTVFCVELAAQHFAVPVVDEFRPQAELAAGAAAKVPPGRTIFLIGRREEEHEAEYAYYLRPPMQRCDDFADFPAVAQADAEQHDGSVYAITPEALLTDLRKHWTVTPIDACDALRPGETEDDRLILVRLDQAII